LRFSFGPTRTSVPTALGRASGAVHSAVRKAVHARIDAAAIEQTIALAASTLGFPATVAVWTWVRDMLPERARRGRPGGRVRQNPPAHDSDQPLRSGLSWPDPVKNSGDDAVTTREVELVDRGQRGFDALDEHLLQAPACAKQARLHRLLCDAQTLRDLGAAHSLDRAQDEDRAEVFGKRRHRFLEQRSHLDIARLLLWARSPRRGHELWLGKTRLSETC